MSIRLDEDEAWAVVEQAHTGILTTLKADGAPITLPVWFAVLDRTVCFSTPGQTKKVRRIRRDPRASFLVEDGERWAELRAVHLQGRIEVVDDEVAQARISDALDTKYAPYRTARAAMPRATAKHYSDRVFLRLVPDARLLTWDNRRIAVQEDAPS